MIQRVQTIWLLVAALLCASVFYFDLYTAHTLMNNIDTVVHVRVNDHYPSLILALVITVLPFVAIFMFKNRKQQRSMVLLSIIAVIGFIALMIIRITDYTNKMTSLTKGSYAIGAVLPVFAIVFLIMAMRGIRNDEKLIKSLDRLR